MSVTAKNYILIVFLILLTGGAYEQIITHEFISYDDPYYITENPMIARGLSGDTALWAINTFRAGFWIPLTWLGMVTMYYKTKDEEYGMVQKVGDHWEYTPVYDSQAKEEIIALFDSMKKQIRTGFFVIPNALPKGSNQ